MNFEHESRDYSTTKQDNDSKYNNYGTETINDQEKMKFHKPHPLSSYLSVFQAPSSPNYMAKQAGRSGPQPYREQGRCGLRTAD